MNTETTIHDADIDSMIKVGKPFSIIQDRYDILGLRKNYAYYPEHLTEPIGCEFSIAIFKVTPKIKPNVPTNL